MFLDFLYDPLLIRTDLHKGVRGKKFQVLGFNFLCIHHVTDPNKNLVNMNNFNLNFMVKLACTRKSVNFTTSSYFHKNLVDLRPTRIFFSHWKSGYLQLSFTGYIVDY